MRGIQIVNNDLNGVDFVLCLKVRPIGHPLSSEPSGRLKREVVLCAPY